MSDSRQFRENAEACERMARASPFARDREGFLKLAAQWRARAEAAEAREKGETGGGDD